MFQLLGDPITRRLPVRSNSASSIGALRTSNPGDLCNEVCRCNCSAWIGLGSGGMRLEFQFGQHQRELERHSSWQWQYHQLCVRNLAGSQRERRTDHLQFQFHDEFALFSIGYNGDRRIHAEWKLQWTNERHLRDERAVRNAGGKYTDPQRHRPRQHDYRDLDADWNFRLHGNRHFHHDEDVVGHSAPGPRTKGRPEARTWKPLALTSIDAPARISLFS